MINSKIAYLIVLLGMLAHQSTWAQEPICAQKNEAFLPGERVTYKAGYKWGFIKVNAGEATFSVDTVMYQGKPSIHFVGEGKTYPAYDSFYRVRDRFETYSSVEDLRPYRYIRDTNEGGYKVYNNNRFEYEDGLTYVERRGVRTINMFDTMAIHNCTYDALSMIYNARSIDFDRYAPDDSIPISIFLDEEVYDLNIRYLRKEVIKHDKKKYRCVLISPTLVSGTIFKEGDEMKVWITDDKNRIPLVVESPLVVGHLRAEVKGWENVRHPFTSLVE